MPVNPTDAPSDLGQIQKLISAGELPAALKQLEDLPEDIRGSVDGLYMTAVCNRHMGRLAEAEEQLLRLVSIAPEFSRAHQELGHLRKGQGRARDALTAYVRACTINPALVASWRSQLAILQASPGDETRQRQEQISAQLNFLHSLHPHILAATDMMHEGKLIKSENLCRRFLQQNPKNIEGMRLLAELGLRLGVLEDAEFLLESAAEFEPDNIRVRLDYVQVLQKRQRFAHAHDESLRLLEIAPENPQFQSLHAIQCMQIGDYESALETFEKVLGILPGDPTTYVSRGHALKTSGDTEAAIESYRSAVASRPHHCEAYYSLANLKTYHFTDKELAAMHAVIQSSDLTPMERVYLNFALGKAAEDRGDFETAFGHYATGNDLKQSQTRYQADDTTEEFSAQKRACTKELFSSREKAGCQAPDPIFIVGLPRAGSTLLEQILSSHSQVDGTLELPNILSLASRLRRQGRASGTPYPDNLASISAEQLVEFGEQFIEDTRIHRQGAPLFIDKMPNNFRHIGLIKLILPNAKVIDARRAPMACCFSAYKQLFADGQLFSYSLGDIGSYYRDYVDLMRHWDEVLPGFVLRVQHEDVVRDLEGQVRRMLDFCGLEFEESCLNYHKTERNVRTPSSEQVRQPIFDTALEQWRHFEPWLDPLKEALGPELVPRD
ncbi:MAG: sulfotransferase [Halioglobus sp.]